jgi:tetratricopeptide (TPR) repeat protein
MAAAQSPVAHEPFDGLPTVEDIRLALRAWHQPVRLAKTRLANSKLVFSRLHLPNSSSENAFAAIPATRQLLLDALGQLKITQSERLGQELHNSLVYSKYVLQQPAHAICHDRGFAAATLDRHLARELAELCAILVNVALALPANGGAANTHPPSFANDIPRNSIFVGRTAQLEQAREALLTQPQQSTQESIVAIAGYPGAGKTTLATALAHNVGITQHYTYGVLWASVGHNGGVREVLARWLVQFGIDDGDKLPLDQQRSTLRTALAGKRVLIVLDDVWRAADAYALMLGGLGAAYLLTTRQLAVAHAVADTVITLDAFDHAETLALLRHHLKDDVLRHQRLNANLDDLAATLRGLPLTVSVAARHLSMLAKTGQHRRFNAYVANAYREDRAQAFANRLLDVVHALDETTQRALATLAHLPPKPTSHSERFARAICQCENGVFDALIDAGLLEAQQGRYSLHPAIAESVGGLLDMISARPAIIEQTAAVLSDSTQTALTSHDVATIGVVLALADTAGDEARYVAIVVNAVRLIEDSGDLPMLLAVLAQAKRKAATLDETQPWRDQIEIHLAHARWLAAPSEENYVELMKVADSASRSADAGLVAIASRTLADITFERDDFANAIDFANNAATAWRDYQAKHKERMEATALRRYMLRSSFEKLREMLVRVIPASIAKAVPAPQVQVAVTAKGWLDVLHGDVAQGISQLNDCFERAARNGYPLPDVFAAGALAWSYYHLGDYGKARLLGYHVIHAPHRDVFPDFVGQAYHALAASAMAQGDLAGAWSFLIEGLNYCDDHSADALASALNTTLASWHLQHDNPQEAWLCAEMALKTACHLHFEPMVPAALAMMGTVACKMGKRDEARGRFEEMAAFIAKRRPSPWTEAYCRLYHGRFLLACEMLEAAGRELLHAVELGRRLGAPEFVGLGCFGLAQLKWLQGEVSDSNSLVRRSVNLLRTIGHAAADMVKVWQAAIPETKTWLARQPHFGHSDRPVLKPQIAT